MSVSWGNTLKANKKSNSTGTGTSASASTGTTDSATSNTGAGSKKPFSTNTNTNTNTTNHTNASHYYDDDSNTSTSLLTDDEYSNSRRGSSISDIGDMGVINNGIKLSSGTYHQPYDDYLRIVSGNNTNNTNNSNNSNSNNGNNGDTHTNIKPETAESKLNTFVTQENQNYSNIRRQRGISMGSNVSAGSW